MTPLRPRSAARRRCMSLGLAAVAVLVAGCSGGSAPTTYDLSAPREVPRSGARGSILVVEPTTVQVLDSDRIIVKDAGGSLSFVGGGQWADRLPRLVQTRLIQTFENANRLASVARPGERVSADWQLNTDIRSFNIDGRTGEAVVEITAKLVADRTGRVAAARLFSARVPAGAVEAATATAALDRALSQVLIAIVGWTRG